MIRTLVVSKRAVGPARHQITRLKYLRIWVSLDLAHRMRLTVSIIETEARILSMCYILILRNAAVGKIKLVLFLSKGQFEIEVISAQGLKIDSDSAQGKPTITR